MKKIFVLVLLVFVLLPVSVSAQDYYVDATNGNDAWSGNYPEPQGSPPTDGPWQTWNKVRGQTYSHGDTIKFKRDEVWNDIAYAWTMDDSGTPGNYITIEDYGTGNKPIWDLEEELQGSTWTEETGEGSNIWSTSYTTTVKRVRLDGQDSYPASSASGIDGIDYLWYWGSSKLYIYSAQNPNNEYTNIKVTDDSHLAFRFQGCSYVKIKNIEMHGGVRTIDFRNGVGYDESNIIIEYCDIWYFYQAIISDKDAGGTANNVTLRYNDIDTKLNLISKNVPYSARGVYDTIKIEQNGADWHIHHNNISNSGHSLLDIRSSASASQGVNNNIIEYNTFDSSESVYSRAVDIWGPSGGKATNNIYRYNIEKNCNVRSQFGGENTQIYYNLIYNRTDNPATDYSNNAEGVYLDTIGGDSVCDGVKVYNNVFYSIFNEAITISDCDNAVVKNNICIDAGKGGDKLNICIYLSGNLGTGNVIEYNDFYDADTLNVVNYKGSVETVAYADANRAEFSNNINSDPLFVNAPNIDFRLQSGSPAIDNGMDVGLTMDFEGNPVPQGNGTDIGAYEYEYVGETPVCEPNTYYVDATNGNNSNDGTCTNTAWKTIGHVNSQTFSPGDFILFKKGEHWREQLTVPSPGNATHPITFGAYGTGSLPIIDGSEELTSWTLYSGDIWYSDELSIYPRVVWLDGESYFEAANADSVNSINRWHWDGTATRLYVYAASSPSTFYSISGVEAPTRGYALLSGNMPYIKLQNLHFKYGRLYSVYFSSGADHCEMKGIIVDGSGQYGALYLNGVDYCTIDNCTINGDNKAGQNNAFGIYNGATSNTVRNCTISNGSHAALQLKKAYNSIIEYNEIYSGYEFGRCIGLNHENGEGGGNIVRYNYFHDSQGDDTPHSQSANQFAGDGDEIYYNLFAGTHHWGVYIWSESDIYPTQNMKFYNNVIYGFRDQGIRVNLKTDSATGNVFKNNIIISNDPTNHYQVSFKFSQGPNRATFENNCIYSSDTSSTVEVGGTARTVAYMETNYPGSWANNIVADPLFFDAPNEDFRLQSTSPCIDNGTDVGLTLDFEGNPVPQPPGGNPDIGVYEYVSGEAISGDLNNDGSVDIFDLGIIAGDFGKTSNFNDPDSDTDNSGEVDIFDVVFVASRFT